MKAGLSKVGSAPFIRRIAGWSRPGLWLTGVVMLGACPAVAITLDSVKGVPAWLQIVLLIFGVVSPLIGLVTLAIALTAEQYWRARRRLQAWQQLGAFIDGMTEQQAGKAVAVLYHAGGERLEPDALGAQLERVARSARPQNLLSALQSA